MNDGATWGSVDGAYIIDITEDQHDALCDTDLVQLLKNLRKMRNSK